MITTRVESVSSLNRRMPLSFDSHGHDAFPSSARTSPKKFFVFVIMRRFKNQVRRDSNPQPTVLETATLPIELLTYRDFRFWIADFRFQENRQLLSFIRQSAFGNLQFLVSPECPPHDRRRRFCRLRESRTG